MSDLARVWLAERRFSPGDRKPGHYLITDSGNGFGVDYQFLEDTASWEETNQYLPKLLGLIHPSLLEAFNRCVQDQAMDFGVEKALPRPMAPADWDRSDTVTELEKTLARGFQQKISRWYRKAVAGAGQQQVRKAQDFDPSEPSLTNGESVYQNGVKYPLSVSPANQQPARDDLAASVDDYR